MTVRDDVLREVNRKAGLTEAQIATILFGAREGYQQRVNSTCRRLIQEGILKRQGRGGARDPFTYRLAATGAKSL